MLHTGHCLIDTATGAVDARSAPRPSVRFADVTDAEIDLYCATGEPLAVAGAFTIDGLGGWFIDGVDGDPHTVVGVSLPALRRMLRDARATAWTRSATRRRERRAQSRW